MEEESSGEEEYIPVPEEEEKLPTRRGRRRQIKLDIDKDLEEELKKLDGSSLVKVLNFLHKTYLSWITEAEAEKYYTVSTRAFDEALKRQEKTITEISEQFSKTLSDKIAPVLDSLDKRLKELEERIESVEEKATEKKGEIDERLITLALVFADAFTDKVEALKQYKPLIQALLGKTVSKIIKEERKEEEQKQE